MANVINDCKVVIGTVELPTAAWFISMASQYADRSGMAEITLSEYAKTDEYKAQANRNMRAADAIENADILATGGDIRPAKNRMTEPYQKGDLGQF